VPRGFPLFKRCEWLVVNRDVVKRTSPTFSYNGFDLRITLLILWIVCEALT